MSENDELVESANELPGADHPAEDGGAVPEPQDVVEETVSSAEEAPVPAEAEHEETPDPEAASADLEMTEDVARVDLNIASEEELQALPGIGPLLAARIVNYRVEVQPFQDPADITAVPGVSDAMYARIADLLTAGPVDLPPITGLDPVDLEAEYVAASMAPRPKKLSSWSLKPPSPRLRRSSHLSQCPRWPRPWINRRVAPNRHWWRWYRRALAGDVSCLLAC